LITIFVSGSLSMFLGNDLKIICERTRNLLKPARSMYELKVPPFSALACSYPGSIVRPNAIVIEPQNIRFLF